MSEQSFRKDLQWWESRGYCFRPTVTFLLEVHNMSKQAINIIRGLRKYEDSEIVVIDDGSSSDHTLALLDELCGVNEFVLHFNDLFSIVTQNRAIGFSRGQYIVKLQDDDLYPGRAWIDSALELFRAYPDLAIIGGRGNIAPADNIDFSGPIAWTPQPEARGFRFVHAVNEAPMWMRRSAFLDLGGFEEKLAPVQWGEPDLCTRAWLSGMSVGWYESGAKICAVRTPARRGMKNTLEHQARLRNRSWYGEQYVGILDEVNDMVRERNQSAGIDS